MSLISLKCPSCDADLEVDDELKYTFCQFCGNKFMLKDTIDRTISEGTIKTCSNCGRILRSFVKNCPNCGVELRDISSSAAIEKFIKRLEVLENQRNDSKLQEFVRELGISSGTKVDNEILNLIRTFNVPNTKEDVTEFMILASSNIDYDVLSYSKFEETAGKYTLQKFRANTEKAYAWIAKMEQVYDKAYIMFGEDADFYKINRIYSKVQERLKKVDQDKIQHTKDKSKDMLKNFWLPLIGFCMIVFLAIIISTKDEESQSLETPKASTDISSLIINNVYPSEDVSSKLYNHVQEVPDIIYNTLAKENGLTGTVYVVRGTVEHVYNTQSDLGEALEIDAEDIQNFREESKYNNIKMILIKTENGEAIICDFYTSAALNLIKEEGVDVLEATLGSFNGYTEYPNDGEYADILCVYKGYSQVYDRPMFYYGINSECYSLLF